jgi:carbon-monoxide dehydrogenase medium subunit
MIPAQFDYFAPHSLEEAINVLSQHADDAKILAGGHSLLPLMKLRLASPGVIIDLGKITSLAYIRDGGDHVAIGPMTTHYAIESSSLLRERVPLLPATAALVGDMQVRNRGTIGGSIAHADPASDMPTVALALGAQVVAVGPGGERVMPAEEFFVHIWTSALRSDEVLVEIRVPYGSGTPQQAYEKIRMRASDWAVVAAAVDLRTEDGVISRASVALTNVGPTPMRARGVEAALVGAPATAATIATAAARAADGLEPSDELKGSAEYKLGLAPVAVRRALERALGVGQGA